MNSRCFAPYFLVGWLLGATTLGTQSPAPLPERISRPTPLEELLSHGTARELRRFKGLGPKRAQALIDARSAEGELPPLEEIPGIGPLTASTMRASLSPPTKEALLLERRDLLGRQEGL